MSQPKKSKITKRTNDTIDNITAHASQISQKHHEIAKNIESKISNLSERQRDILKTIEDDISDIEKLRAEKKEEWHTQRIMMLRTGKSLNSVREERTRVQENISAMTAELKTLRSRKRYYEGGGKEYLQKYKQKKKLKDRSDKLSGEKDEE